MARTPSTQNAYKILLASMDRQQSDRLCGAHVPSVWLGSFALCTVAHGANCRQCGPEHTRLRNITRYLYSFARVRSNAR